MMYDEKLKKKHLHWTLTSVKLLDLFFKNHFMSMYYELHFSAHGPLGP